MRVVLKDLHKDYSTFTSIVFRLALHCKNSPKVNMRALVSKFLAYGLTSLEHQLPVPGRSHRQPSREDTDKIGAVHPTGPVLDTDTGKIQARNGVDIANASSERCGAAGGYVCLFCCVELAYERFRLGSSFMPGNLGVILDIS